MRAVILAIVAVAAFPALADDRWDNNRRGDERREEARWDDSRWGPRWGDEFVRDHGTAVVVSREHTTRKLDEINSRINDAMGKLSRKDRVVYELLRDARDRLTEVRERVAFGPEPRYFDTYMNRGQRGPNVRVEVPMSPGPGPGPGRPPQPPPAPAVYPMADNNFRGLMNAIQKESFSADQLRVLGQAAPGNWFTVAQIKQILPLFSFSRDRLQAMQILRPQMLDNEKAFELYGSFEFASDKEELKKILR